MLRKKTELEGALMYNKRIKEFAYPIKTSSDLE